MQKRARSDLVFITLIDILVQIIFVAIIFLSYFAYQQSKLAGGFDLTRPWQTLVEGLGYRDTKLKPREISIEILKEIEDLKKRAGDGRALCSDISGKKIREIYISATVGEAGVVLFNQSDELREITGVKPDFQGDIKLDINSYESAFANLFVFQSSNNCVLKLKLKREGSFNDADKYMNFRKKLLRNFWVVD